MICRLLSLLFLIAAGPVLERLTRLHCHLLGMIHQSLGQTQRRFFEIPMPHASRAQEPIHATGVTNRTRCSTKPHTAETSQSSDDILPRTLYKCFHGIATLERLIFLLSIPYTKKKRLSFILVVSELSNAAPSARCSLRPEESAFNLRLNSGWHLRPE